MPTPKKKHLIELMIEASVEWPEGAKYATQDKDTMHVRFYEKGKPFRSSNVNYWDSLGGSLIRSVKVKLPELCSNWHQTIVTRKQYEQALSNTIVTAEIQAEPKHCESVVNQEPYTINQLASDYYAKVAEAECLQYKADKALKLANEALITLQKAGELIGLIISVDTLQKCTEQYQQPVITDWRDLRVGDVVEHIEDNGGNLRIGSIGKINQVCEECIKVDYDNWSKYGYGIPDDLHKFRFISRP